VKQVPSARQKLVVVSIFTALWALVIFSRTRFAGGETALDPSWWIGLAGLLQQGQISGRDFHFTYGPLGQLLAWAGTTLTTTHSPFDSYSMISLLACSASAVLIGATLLLTETTNWRRITFIYLSAAYLNLFFEMGSYRPALLLCCCAVIHKCVNAETHRRRRWLACASGLMCFWGQLATPEIGIFAFATALIVIALDSWKSKHPIHGLYLAGIVSGVYVAANLALSVFFRLTSNAYDNLFDYQRYALSTMTGYHNGMGLPWTPGPQLTVTLFAVVLCAAAAAIRSLRNYLFRDVSLLVSFAIGSTFSIANALTRSEMGQVIHALTPFAFTFLMAGPNSLRSERTASATQRNIGPLIWIAAYIMLVATWPNAGVQALDDLWALAQRDPSPARLWEEIRTKKVAPEVVLPMRLIRNAGSGTDPMLAFPYHNYIPVLLGRPIVAPILQNYSAGTLSLQDFYVRTLERYKQTGLDVVYAVDHFGAWPVDGVQAIARTPAVFKFFYTNYGLEEDQSPEDAIYYLHKLNAPRTAHATSIPFETVSQKPSGIEIRLPESMTCGVMEIDLKMNYSHARTVMRPNAVLVAFALADKILGSSYLRPIAIGQYFTTYVSILRPEDFHRIFTTSPVPSNSWDRMIVTTPKDDWLGLDPSAIDIRGIRCLDPHRFVPDERLPEMLNERFGPPPDLFEGPTQSGYVRLEPSSPKVPTLYARLANFTDVPAYSDLTTLTPTRLTEIDLGSVTPEGLGLAVANPGARDAVIMFDLQDETRKSRVKRQISLLAGHHHSQFLNEFFPLRHKNGDVLIVSANEEVSVACIRFGYNRIRVLTENNQQPQPGKSVFPQFVMYGGWGTEIVLTNQSNEIVMGKVLLRTSSNAPLSVPLNGVKASEFDYLIQPGETMKLSPTSNKQ